MIELTEEQRHQLGVSTPLRLRDPRTNEIYVLVREDVYGKLRALLDEEFDPAEAYPAIDAAFREGWDDPKMAEYDRYEERRP